MGGLLLFLGACEGTTTPEDAGGTPQTLEAGDHEFFLTHAGRTRYFQVHAPPAAADGRPLPVVVALHGGGGSPDQFKPESGLDEVADREGFLSVFPAGTGVFARTLLTWNAGTECCGFALDNGVDDVGFLLAVVDDLAQLTPIDLDRVYFTGHSNGGIMAYRMAAEAADRVAAIAPVAGAMMLDGFNPTRAVPLLHIHSVDDPRALYDGGLGPPFPIGGGQVLHRPVLDGISAWRLRNGCSDLAQLLEQRQGSIGSIDEGQRAEKLSWEPCSRQQPVVHWRLYGVGHGWPGAILTAAREELVGPSTGLLLAAEEVWAFFESHSLP